MATNLRIADGGKARVLAEPECELEISTLLEALPDAALVCNCSGKIVEANSALEALAGVSRERLLQLNIEKLARHLWVSQDPSVIDAKRLSSVRALRGEVVRNETYVLRGPNDDLAHEVRVSASPIRGPRGEITGALLVIRDVTEIAELKRNIDHAERQRAVGQMAAGLAHDFNNVLDTIGQAGAVLDMKMDAPPEERRLYVAMIRGAVQQGGEIVSRVRDFIVARAGRRSALDLCKLLEECTQLTRPLWQATRVRLVRDFSSVPPVWANPSDLRRAFTNLIINALEAMPEGGRLTIRCAEEGGQLKVAVTDTGSGISQESQGKIFRPYFTTKAEGTGIGLSGAQSIVRAHGGDIGFESKPGAGTTFRVTLPAMQAEERPRST